MPTSENGTYIWDVDHQEWKNLGNFIGEQGAKGDPGNPGAPGADGVTPSIIPTVGLNENGGNPYATVTKSGTDTNPILDFQFYNLKGAKGDTGTPGQNGVTPNVYATASVNSSVGTPSVSVTKTGTAAAPHFAFTFSNLKGEPGTPGTNGTNGRDGTDGQDGADGADGQDGVTPNITATASVGTGTGTPTVTVTKSGTLENPAFAFAFNNLKGETGATGAQGPAGQDGADGAAGAPGVGVPAGGSAGQVLAKASGSDYDTTWVTPSGGASNIITMSSVILGDNGNGLAPAIPNNGLDEVALPPIINIGAIGELWDVVDLRAYLRWRGDGVNPYTWWSPYAGGGSGALYNRTIYDIIDVNKWYSVDGFYIKEVLTGSNLKFETSEIINGAGAQVLTISPKMRKGHALYPRYLSEVLNSQVSGGYVSYQNADVNRVVPTSSNSVFKTLPVPYYADEEHPTDPAYNHNRNIDVMYTYTLKRRIV